MTENIFTATAFNKYLAEHKLMGTRSRASGRIFVPPRPVDPGTHSDEMEWVELAGKGRLLAFTVVNVGPSAMIAVGYDRKNPYCVGIVRLDEGPKISAQILDVDVAHPEKIKIGMELRVAFIERGEGNAKKTFLGFKPASAIVPESQGR
jgi:uncharacterized protein